MRPWLIALLLTLTAGTAQAGTLRCGTSLINEGDPMDEVLAKCGQPDKRVVTPPTKPRRGPDGKFIPGNPQLETWMYGPNNGAYRYLFFRDTQLQLINTTRKELLCAPRTICPGTPAATKGAYPSRQHLPRLVAFANPEGTMHSQFDFTLGIDPQARDVVVKGLLAYNLGQMGRSNTYDDFELYARSDDGEVVGGMFGQSGMGWLYIDYLWLQDDQRGSGLGSQLIALAEDEARRRGCVGLFLYTYSFQAPGFYEKQGFERMGVLEDCPPGHQRIYLKKQLG